MLVVYENNTANSLTKRTNAPYATDKKARLGKQVCERESRERKGMLVNTEASMSEIERRK